MILKKKHRLEVQQQPTALAMLLLLGVVSTGFSQTTASPVKNQPAPESHGLSLSYTATLASPAGKAPDGVSQPSLTDTFASGFMARFQKTYHWWLGYQINYGFSSIGIRRNVNDYAYSLIQSGMHEISAAYLLKGPSRYGFKTFAEAGGGALIFAPSNGSAETVATYNRTWGGVAIPKTTVVSREYGLETQSRAAGIFGVGISYDLNKHFGARAEYRALAYMTPTFKDGTAFGEQQMTLGQQPSAGMYFKF